MYSPDDEGEGLKKSGNTSISGIKAVSTDLFPGTQITVLEAKMNGKTSRECIDLMFWGVFYRRVYRLDVKMRVETIELMNTQFFNDLLYVYAII